MKNRLFWPSLIGGFALLVNQFAFSFVNFANIGDNINKKVQKTCLSPFKNVKFRTARDNLLASHFMASRVLPEFGRYLFSKEGVDCTEYSETTFGNYLKLVEGTDLERNLRLVAGYVGSKPHQWIEYYDKGKWNIFETHHDHVRLGNKNLERYVNTFNPQPLKGNYSPRLFMYPDRNKDLVWSNILTDPRGTFLR